MAGGVLGSGSPFVRLVCDAAAVGAEGPATAFLEVENWDLLDGGLEGGQGLEQLLLGPYSLVVGLGSENTAKHTLPKRCCVCVCVCVCVLSFSMLLSLGIGPGLTYAHATPTHSYIPSPQPSVTRVCMCAKKLVE